MSKPQANQPRRVERSQRAWSLSALQQTYLHGRSPRLPLADTAAGIWFVFERSRLDVARLERAWYRLVARHDGLRLALRMEDKDCRQTVLAADSEEATAGRFTVFTATEQTATHRKNQILRALKNGTARSGALAPMRVFAVAVDGIAESVVVAFDFMAFDASSIREVLSDWQCLYEEGHCRPLHPGASFSGAVETISSLIAAATPTDQAYWERRVPELPGAPTLPLLGRPDTLTQTTMEREVRRFDRDLLAALDKVAADLRIPLADFFASVFAEALGRWGDDEAFSLMSMSTLRDRLGEASRPVVGNFQTLLVADYDRRPATFAARAQGFAARLEAARAHFSFDGQAVLRLWSKHRNEPRTTLPVACSINLDSGPAVERSHLWLGEAGAGGLVTPFVVLDHHVFQTAEGFYAAFDFVPGALSPAFVSALAEVYERTLRDLASGTLSPSEVTCVALPAADRATRDRVNATLAVPEAGLLHTDILSACVEHASRTAVVTSGRTMTYADLEAEAAGVCLALRKQGLSPGDVVAVHLAKGWEQIVAVLGILQAGGVYLPLDATHPEERVAAIMNTSAARFAVAAQSPVDGRFGSASVLPFESIAAAGFDEVLALRAEAPVQKPEDLAYVIFTSGSTGQPKGVMIDHRGAKNTCWDVNDRFQVSAEDAALALSQLNFDLSVYDVFGLLAVGGKIVIPTGDEGLSPLDWLRLAQTHGVTLWNSVPSLFRMACQSAALDPVRFPPTLRLALLSGDWIPLDLPAKARDLAPSLHLVSLGGATEASIWSIAHDIQGVDPSWKSIPYGRPLRGQTFRVVNRHLEDQPAGVEGELLIGGVGVAKGYMNDPERTRRSFISCPVTGETLYRTGDLGRYLPNGDIEFLGRTDFQVKVNGYRIELEDIETKALDYPGLADAKAVVVGDRFQAKRLVLFVVEATPETVVCEGLTAFLAARLPSYMVPRQIVPTKAIPLTPNGKVDRKALAAAVPAPSAEPCKRDGSAACWPEALERLWIQTLGLTTLDPDAGFFELGGDSVNAINFLAEVERELGIALHASEIFRMPVFRDFAAHLQSRQCGTYHPVAPLGPVCGRAPLFLVHPVGGGISCYEALASRLADRFDVFGLRCPTEAEFQAFTDQDAARSVARLARLYAEAVHAQVGATRIRLGGWSFGGIVSYAMVAELESLGIEVEQLVLIDAVLTEAGAAADKAADLAKFQRIVVQGRALDQNWVGAAYQVFARNMSALRAFRPAPGRKTRAQLVWATREDHVEPASFAWRRAAQVEGTLRLDATHETIVRDPAHLDRIAQLFLEQ